MKKILALLLALAMIISFAACGSDEYSFEDDDDETEDTEESKEDDKDAKEDDKGDKEDKDENKDKDEDKNKDESKASILGTWNGVFDIAEAYDKALSTSMGTQTGTIKEFKIPLTLKFLDEKNYTVIIDKAQFEKNIDGIMDAFSNSVIQVLDATFQQKLGTTLDAYLQAQNMTKEAYLQMNGLSKEQLKASLLEGMKDSFEEEKGTYEIKDGNIYMKSEDPEDTEDISYFKIKELTETKLELQIVTNDTEIKEMFGENFIIVFTKA